MTTSELCVPVVWTLCDRQEAWSVWAALLQALFAGIAIYAAVSLATRQERRAVARRTEVIVEFIKLAAMEAAMIKTFFGIAKGEEPREVVYGAQRKIFEQYAQALRSVSLDNVADFRLLVPMHRTAASCEVVAGLLGTQIPKNGSPELKMWFGELKKAQTELSESYRRACVVQGQYSSVRFISVFRNAFRRWRFSRQSK
ncbi:hypothetical protein [Xanthomonas graminis]|uniref:hypothetical protein n=1 Tax=Xanthomonas graminis TaxID=3390026 RepID=UPI0009BD9EE6|nr:hypothetical protein [Xanthomonas translucens]